MATHALDLTTILKAFIQLEADCFSKGIAWKAINPLQAEIFELLGQYRDDVEELRDLIANVTINPPFGIIVTSVLDKTVCWIDGVGEEAAIRKDGKEYPAFRLRGGCRVLGTEPHGGEPLLEIETKNGDRLYIMMCDKEMEGMALAKKVLGLSMVKWSAHPDYEPRVKATIPKVDFSLEPDIDFLVGASTTYRRVDWSIDKATQKFRFRMNEKGARAVVETVMFLMTSINPKLKKKEQIIIDRPFIGWFVQPGSAFPMAPFYADTDSWKASGKLEDL